eukprot:8527132-Ditylum_brightwellii.AAC.1
MKIDAKSIEFANCLVENRPPLILFYVPGSDKKLSPLDYQTYKLRTNPKDEKLAVYSLTVKYYKVGHQRTGYLGWQSSLFLGEKSTEGGRPASLPEQGGKSGSQRWSGIH